MRGFVTTTAQLALAFPGHGEPASWYVPGSTVTVSPGCAASTAAWMDSPGCTIQFSACAAPAKAEPASKSDEAAARESK